MSSRTGIQQTPRPPLTRAAFGVAGATGAVLVTMSGGYGYHRDELYFLVAGAHPAWGYPDQPPLTPLLARATTLLGDSLFALRLPSALAIAAVVVLTALIAREFGARPAAQLLAACCTAVSTVVIAVGHLLSTTTFDLLAWTALSWLLIRALRGAHPGLGSSAPGGPVWLAVGLVAGIGLLNKTLIAFYLAALVVALLTVGPRAALRSPWPWLGAGVALVLWLPNLLWQASHGWPLLELSSSIAAGGSASSEPRWLFLPFQLVLVSPLLVPVWGIGLWRLLRDPQLRTFRLFGIAYPLLAAVFIVTGGKPYYLAGLYPVLLAAGAGPVWDWARRSAPRSPATLRTGLVSAVLAVTATISAVLMLPVVPPHALAGTPIPEINSDAGATLDWPALVATVAGVHRSLPPDELHRAVILIIHCSRPGQRQLSSAGHGRPTLLEFFDHAILNSIEYSPVASAEANLVDIDLAIGAPVFAVVASEQALDDEVATQGDVVDLAAVAVRAQHHVDLLFGVPDAGLQNLDDVSEHHAPPGLLCR